MDASLEEAYRTYHSRLYTLALRITGEREAADDVVQTAFLNAIAAWGSFEKRSAVYTWLYAIVVNAARKYMRKEQAVPVDRYADEHGLSVKDVYEHIGGYGELPDSDAVVEQVREQCLQVFLDCLPADYRIIYTLRTILQCSVRETAEILGISEIAVKIRHNRAREHLKKHFNGRCSLVCRDGLCSCRKYAAYLKATGRAELVAKWTRRTGMKGRFDTALKDILEVDELYTTEFEPVLFEKLKTRIEKLINEGKNELLS